MAWRSVYVVWGYVEVRLEMISKWDEVELWGRGTSRLNRLECKSKPDPDTRSCGEKMKGIPTVCRRVSQTRRRQKRDCDVCARRGTAHVRKAGAVLMR